MRDERPWTGTAPPAAFCRFPPDRKAIWPKQHLADFQGWMHADGYAGFESLYHGGGIQEVACMAHIWRKLFDVHQAVHSLTADRESQDRPNRIQACWRRMACYDLSDFECSAIQPVLPQKSRGVPRVDDRRVLNGMFWVLRSGAPRADLPERYGPVTTCYNRFRRWSKDGIWDQIIGAVSDASGGGIKMIDGTGVRVHRAAATLKKATRIVISDEAGAVLQRKSMAVVDGRGLPVGLAISAGQVHDAEAAAVLLAAVNRGEMLLADKAYDADWIRQALYSRGAWANIPARSNRKDPSVSVPNSTASAT